MKLETPKLSICIPTYNFGYVISETLESIVPQLTDEVEVIIVDGASTDNTASIVESYIQANPNIKYFCLNKKGGIDNDMAKSIELASGEYCWLFSSDDIMKEGVIGKILTEIESLHDVYICKHFNCTFSMTPINEHPVFALDHDHSFNLASDTDRKLYFSSAETSEAFFSFMSGIVINRSRWNSALPSHDFIGSCWGHAARIIQMIPLGLTVKYISEPCIFRRGDNDSFAENGIVNRYRIAIDGYHRIARTFFQEHSEEAFHIRRVIRRELSLKHFIYAKYLCHKSPEIESRETLNRIAKMNFEDFTISNRASYLVYTVLHPIICGLLYNSYRKWIRAA